MSVIGEVLGVVTALVATILMIVIAIYTRHFRWRSTWGKWIVTLLAWWIVHELIITLDVTLLPRTATGPLLIAWEVGSLILACALLRWIIRQARQP